MKISDILTSSDVIVIDDAVSKKRLLQEMSRKLAEDTGIDERTMFDIVAERENLGSTGFGGLRHVKGVFAKLNKGIDFAACDNRPVDLVFMLVSPENSGADHLSALAQISKIIKDEERCEKIREAATGNDIYRLLTSD